MKKFAAIFAALASLVWTFGATSPALAQGVPAQWSYSNVGNVATATYPGNVIINGTCTNCGLGLPIIGNGATVTTSTPLLQLSQTWNAGATTFTFLNGNVTDTASASGSLLLDLQVGGSSKFKVDKTGQATFANVVNSQGYVSANNGFYVNTNGTNVGINFGTGPDLFLGRDAANTLAQRNGTNAQTFNIYNTYTNASNYERLRAGWTGTEFQFWTEAAGTGAARALSLNGASQLNLGAGGSSQWIITSGGVFEGALDNTYDIGASGANRPRNVNVGNSVVVATDPGGTASLRAGNNANLSGHIMYSGTTPTVGGASCGTSPSVSGSDAAGTITIGGSGTTCVVTFASAYSTAPVCTVTARTQAALVNYGSSTTTLTVTTTSFAGGRVDYICHGT